MYSFGKKKFKVNDIRYWRKAKAIKQIVHEMRIMLNIIKFYGFKGVFFGLINE